MARRQKTDSSTPQEAERSAFSRRQVVQLLLERLNTRPYELTTVESRIEAAVESLGGPVAASEKTLVPFGTLRNWISGATKPSAIALGDLARCAGLSLDWLVDGGDATGRTSVGGSIRAPIELKGLSGAPAIGISRAYLEQRVAASIPDLVGFVMPNDTMYPLIQSGALGGYAPSAGEFVGEGVYALEVGGFMVIRDVLVMPDGNLCATSRNNPQGRGMLAERWRRDDAKSGIKILGRVVWFDTVL